MQSRFLNMKPATPNEYSLLLIALLLQLLLKYQISDENKIRFLR